MSVTPDSQSPSPNGSSGLSTSIKIGAAIIVVVAVFSVFRMSGGSETRYMTYPVTPGPLKVEVLVGGDVMALSKQQLRSQIRGREGAKILSIVEEGYFVTQEDIDAGKVLVELDSKSISDEIVQRDISALSQQAALAKSRQDVKKSINKGESDIYADELAVKFARMELEKYMGTSAAVDILARLDKFEQEHGGDSSLAEIVEESLRQEATAIPAGLPAAGGGAPSGPWGGGSGFTPGQGWGGGMKGGPDGAPRGDGMRAGRRGRGDGDGGSRGSGVRGGPDGGSRGSGMRGGRRGGGNGEGGPRGGVQAGSEGGPRGGGMRGGRRGGGDGGARQARGDGKPPWGDGPPPWGDGPPPWAGGAGRPGGPSVTTADAATPDAPDQSIALSLVSTPRLDIDFTEYAKPERLGDGAANQALRQLDDSLLVAEKDLALSNTRLLGTERLFEKNFVTRNELENDQMDVDKKKISVDSARTAKQLFINYEFPKAAETALSGYIQAKEKLVRTKMDAVSDLSMQRSSLRSNEVKNLKEQERLADLRVQLASATMRATHPGLVVYGGGGDSHRRRFGSQEPIQEGTSVRERQTIITIPDTTSMAVNVNIHESEVQKIKIGQRATLRVDSNADIPLQGEVIKVAVLPDSANQWLNPDLKEYKTTVKIEGVHEWLKPGMNAQVVIHVETLQNVLSVPIQSVVPRGNDQVCYVLKGGEPELRVVETGQITVERAEIISGLEKGDEVLLVPPEGSREDDLFGPTESDDGRAGGETMESLTASDASGAGHPA
jgi:multidrug resistance efflux pump